MQNLIRKIVNLQKEVHVVNSNYPQYFYIGRGRTASANIKYGLDKTTAHWHEEKHFEMLYKIKVNSVLDVVIALSDKYKFKPLIIECTREPISMYISLAFQNIKKKRLILPQSNQYEFVINHIKSTLQNPDRSIPYAENWLKYFGVDIYSEFKPENKYLFKETEKADLLFLRFEDITMRKAIFKSIGIEYVDLHKNNSQDVNKQLYEDVKLNMSIDTILKEVVYDNAYIRNFYTEQEINSFIRKYLK